MVSVFPLWLRLITYGIGAIVCVFLVTPILVLVPLSFTSGSFLTFPLPGVSLRWYDTFFTSDSWISSLRNSLTIGFGAITLSLLLGVPCALALARNTSRTRLFVWALVIAPIVTPGIIIAVGSYFLYSQFGATNSLWGMIIAHTVVAVPFVVIAVHSIVETLDPALVQAAESLGASPAVAFRRIVFPLILPGIASGAIFAFATSLDETVIAMFLTGPGQRTLPVQMFNGLREEVNPTITAASTILVLVGTTLLVMVGLLQRRAEMNRDRAANKP